MNFIPNAWKVHVLQRFRVFELSMGKNQFANIVVTVPEQNCFAGEKLGINTLRANSIVEGEIEFRSSSSPDFTRRRGEDTDPSRLTMPDSYMLRGLADNSKFFCVQSTEEGRMFIPRQIPLESGEEAIIEYRALERNVFVLQGNVSCDGIEHSAFKHLELGQPRDYVFKNESPERAYLLFFYEAIPQEVRLQYSHIPGYKLDTVPALRGNS